MRGVATRQPLGLYVHIPFCAARCPYCDFATAPARSALSTLASSALAVTTSTGSQVRFDPYDAGLIVNPYPMFARLREEARGDGKRLTDKPRIDAVTAHPGSRRSLPTRRLPCLRARSRPEC